MGKSIERRVNDSFGNDENADPQTYADAILDALKNHTNSVKKSAILTVLLMAVFELIDYQKPNDTFSVASFSFSNAPAVLIVLPVIVAYLAYETYFLTQRWVDLDEAYRAITKIIAPDAMENDLNVLIRPALPAFWNQGRVISKDNASPKEKFDYVIGTAFSVIMFILPILFETQAYYRLSIKYGLRNGFFWGSAVISAALLITSMIYAILSDLSVALFAGKWLQERWDRATDLTSKDNIVELYGDIISHCVASSDARDKPLAWLRSSGRALG